MAIIFEVDCFKGMRSVTKWIREFSKQSGQTQVVVSFRFDV